MHAPLSFFPAASLRSRSAIAGPRPARVQDETPIFGTTTRTRTNGALPTHTLPVKRSPSRQPPRSILPQHAVATDLSSHPPVLPAIDNATALRSSADNHGLPQNNFQAPSFTPTRAQDASRTAGPSSFTTSSATPQPITPALVRCGSPITSNENSAMTATFHPPVSLEIPQQRKD
ncbi:hypothetical protein PWT90_09534 [Aphanocladium album]|nr:hypothetical protein PWT90_09534 [Aphanocladium album]